LNTYGTYECPHCGHFCELPIEANPYNPDVECVRCKRSFRHPFAATERKVILPPGPPENPHVDPTYDQLPLSAYERSQRRGRVSGFHGN
jgi:hypothetical protein